MPALLLTIFVPIQYSFFLFILLLFPFPPGSLSSIYLASFALRDHTNSNFFCDISHSCFYLYYSSSFLISYFSHLDSLAIFLISFISVVLICVICVLLNTTHLSLAYYDFHFYDVTSSSVAPLFGGFKTHPLLPSSSHDFMIQVHTVGLGSSPNLRWLLFCMLFWIVPLISVVLYLE